jgi:alpha-L-fucosidase 2
MHMKKNTASWSRRVGLFPILLVFSAVAFAAEGAAVPAGDRHDLVFNALARTWDEGIPLGNGLLGTLVWQKGDSLRLSLDRADLWDLRPIKEFETARFRFSWVRTQILKRDYEPVHEMGDVPYNRDPAPTKIPAGALEFNIASLGEVESVRLALQDALCEVRWKNGARLTTYVHSVEPVGWFKLEGVPESLVPHPVTPALILCRSI